MAKNAMLKAKKLLMAAVLFEMIELVYGVFMQYDTAKRMVGGDGLTASILTSLFIGIAISALVTIALKVFLIRKADAAIENPDCGSTHVIIAWILLVQSVFAAISNVSSLFEATGAMFLLGGALMAALNVFETIVMWLYVRAAKALRA